MTVGIARRLPSPVAGGWLNLAAAVSLLAPTVIGAVVLHAGATAFQQAGVPSRYLWVALWAGEAVLVLMLVARLLTWVSVCTRRGRPAGRDLAVLAGPGHAGPAVGEVVLVDELGVGSREALEQAFAELTAWFGEVEEWQRRHPELALVRTPAHNWIAASVLVLDAAALTVAAAPRWAPPSSRTVLTAGTSCFATLTTELGVAVLQPVVSLHGREERSFADTFQYLLEGGLPVERSEDRTGSEFQRLRVRYAPQAAALTGVLAYGEDHGGSDHPRTPTLFVPTVGDRPAIGDGFRRPDRPQFFISS